MKKTTNKNKTYEAPQLTAVTFKVERGYAFSDLNSSFIHQDANQHVENTTFGRSTYGEATEVSNTQQSWF